MQDLIDDMRVIRVVVVEVVRGSIRLVKVTSLGVSVAVAVVKAGRVTTTIIRAVMVSITVISAVSGRGIGVVRAIKVIRVIRVTTIIIKVSRVTRVTNRVIK